MSHGYRDARQTSCDHGLDFDLTISYEEGRQDRLRLELTATTPNIEAGFDALFERFGLARRHLIEAYRQEFKAAVDRRDI